MKYRYSKFTGDDLDEIDLEELLSRLSDMLLSSGFDDGYAMPGEDGHSLQSLHDAIMEALLNGGLLSDETLERLLGKDWQTSEDAEERLDELIRKIIEKLQHQGYVSTSPDLDAERERRERGIGGGQGQEQAFKFEITDKSLDFLGYRALRDLLGSIGKSSLGRHDTREMATGVEASGAPKPYEFGDTMNLDASATILNAVMRKNAAPLGSDPKTGSLQIDVDYEDLMVAQGEYQSSCATVLMLDCSHSMILYGEDRFTPAKRVALALANLIRLQYPGDALKVVLFHDSAEEIPLTQLARVKVGPVLHQHARGAAARPPPARTAAEGHAADRHDHRRQAVGAHPPGRAHLPQRLRPRSVYRLGNRRRSRRLPERRDPDQHVHAGARLRSRQLRPQGRRDLPRQGVLHDAAHARTVRADGLHGQENAHGTLRLLIVDC